MAMRRLWLQMQMSVDGFMSAHNPAGRWTLWDWGPDCPWDGELVRRFNDTLANVDTVLLSRPMAAGYIDHWTRIAGQRAGDPAFTFAERIVEAHKRVLSRRAGTIDRVSTSVGHGAMRDEITALKQAPGENIICFGGVDFASAVLDTGLVDVLELYVNPRAVARGESIFRRPRSLELLEAQPYACGIVVQRYQPLA
jgi:dihydrofolate reductase